MKIIRPTTITPAMITACNVTETDATYPDWDVGTAYVVGDLVTYEHKFYECLVDSTGEIPEDYTATVPPVWLDLGYNNRWKMFDEVVGSQTSNPETITLTIAPGQTDSISFLDIDATSIEITMTDPSEGIVYTESIDLVSTLGIIDAYTYFFEPIITDDSAVLLDVPPYSAASIDITISNPGGTVLVGTLAFGTQKDLGATQYNPSISLQDYSKKEVDVFGNYSILERAYSKKLSVEMSLPNTSVDDVAKTLALYRATPVIWVGVDSGFSSMIIYGFYRSFSITIKYVNYSICDLELEGLS